MIDPLEPQRKIVSVAVDFDRLIDQAGSRQERAERFTGLLGEQLDVGGRNVDAIGILADAGCLRRLRRRLVAGRSRPWPG